MFKISSYQPVRQFAIIFSKLSGKQVCSLYPVHHKDYNLLLYLMKNSAGGKIGESFCTIMEHTGIFIKMNGVWIETPKKNHAVSDTCSQVNNKKWCT